MQDTAQYIDGVLCTTQPTRRRALKAPHARHSAVHTWSHARHSRHSAGHSRRRMQDTAQYINGALCTTQTTQRRALKAPYARHSAVHTWSHARHSRHGAEHSRRRMKDTAQCTQKALCKTLRSKHTRKRALNKTPKPNKTKHKKKERWGTSKVNTNAIYETTGAQTKNYNYKDRTYFLRSGVHILISRFETQSSI